MTSRKKGIIDTAVQDWSDRICETPLNQLGGDQEDWSLPRTSPKEKLRYNDIVAYGGVDSWWLCVEKNNFNSTFQPNQGQPIGCVRRTPEEIQSLYDTGSYDELSRMLWRVLDKDPTNKRGEVVQNEAPVRLQSVYNDRVYGVTWCNPPPRPEFSPPTESAVEKTAKETMDKFAGGLEDFADAGGSFLGISGIRWP